MAVIVHHTPLLLVVLSLSPSNHQSWALFWIHLAFLVGFDQERNQPQRWLADGQVLLIASTELWKCFKHIPDLAIVWQYPGSEC